MVTLLLLASCGATRSPPQDTSTEVPCVPPPDGPLPVGEWGGSYGYAFRVQEDGQTRVDMPCASAEAREAEVEGGEISWNLLYYEDDTGAPTGSDGRVAVVGHVCNNTFTGIIGEDEVTLALGAALSLIHCD
jgi:hypothetical protein